MLEIGQTHPTKIRLRPPERAVLDSTSESPQQTVPSATVPLGWKIAVAALGLVSVLALGVAAYALAHQSTAVEEYVGSHKAELRGARGPRGPQGAQGEAGPVGPQGPQGEAGTVAVPAIQPTSPVATTPTGQSAAHNAWTDCVFTLALTNPAPGQPGHMTADQVCGPEPP